MVSQVTGTHLSDVGKRQALSFGSLPWSDDFGAKMEPGGTEQIMPNISGGSDVQTVITTFEMTPGTCYDLLEELRDAYANFIRHQPGFIGAGLHVNDAQTRIANYSQWRKREDFLAMLRSGEMRDRNRRISALCKSFEPVMYDVAESFD